MFKQHPSLKFFDVFKTSSTVVLRPYEMAMEGRQRRDWEKERRWREQQLAVPARIGLWQRVRQIWA